MLSLCPHIPWATWVGAVGELSWPPPDGTFGGRHPHRCGASVSPGLQCHGGVTGLGLSPAQHLPSPKLTPHLPHHAPLASVSPFGEGNGPPSSGTVCICVPVSAVRAGFGPKPGHCSLPGAGCCGVGGSTHRHPHPHPLQAPAAGPRCWSCSLYGNRLHRAGCRGHPSPKWHSKHTGVAGGQEDAVGGGGAGSRAPRPQDSSRVTGCLPAG